MENKTKRLHLTQLKSILNQLRGRKATELIDKSDPDLEKLATNYKQQAEYLKNKYDITGGDIVFYSDKGFKNELARIPVSQTTFLLDPTKYTQFVVRDTQEGAVKQKPRPVISDGGVVFSPEPHGQEQITVESSDQPHPKYEKLVVDLEYDVKNIKGKLSDTDYLKLRRRITKVSESIRSNIILEDDDNAESLEDRLYVLERFLIKNHKRKITPGVKKEKVDDEERQKTYRKNRAKPLQPPLFYFHSYGPFKNRKTKKEIRHLVREDEDEEFYKVASFLPNTDAEEWILYRGKNKPFLSYEEQQQLKPITGLSLKGVGEEYQRILRYYSL